MDREAQEKDEVPNREGNMMLCIVIAWGVVFLLSIKLLFFSYAGDVVGSRITQLEQQIAGLEELWSIPEHTLINENSGQFQADLKGDDVEVQRMDRAYDDVRELKASIGEVADEITEIHTLRNRGVAAIEDVDKTLEELHGYNEDMKKKLHDGLQTISAGARETAKQAVGSAVTDMRNGIDANEKKSADELQQDLARHWQLIESSVKRLNSTLDAKTRATSIKLDRETDALSTSVNAELATVKASVSQALALSEDARRAGADARTTANLTMASIKGVAFLKSVGQDCPKGSKKCDAWYWISPQPLDPYCSKTNASGQAWSDGSCGVTPAGVQENIMFGCCRE